MVDEKEKWDINKLDGSINELKDEFVELQLQLHYLAIKISLWALKTFQQGKNESLNNLQIRQIVEHEIDMIVDDLSKPKFLEVTFERTLHEWKKMQIK